MEYEIEIPGWGNYHPRKDIKEAKWFRLNVDTPTSRGVFNLKPNEKWVFICLLCYYGSKNKEKIRINDEYFSWYSGVSKKEIESSLMKLSQNETILLNTHTNIHTDIQHSPHVRTDTYGCVREKNAEFDFNVIYDKYPNKIGKKKGLEYCAKKIKTNAQYDALQQAVKNYSEYCNAEKVEPKYIKHFSTFMNCYEDWEHPQEKWGDDKTDWDLVFGRKKDE